MKHFKRKTFRFIQSYDNSRIVFPLCFKTYRFKAQHYRPYMTQNKITLMELTTFFEEVYEHSNHFAALRKWTSSFLFALSGLCLINIFITFLYPLLVPVDKRVFLKSYLPEALVSVNFVLFLITLIASLRIEQGNYKKARECVQETIRARSAYFNARGLKWELPNKSMDYLALINDEGNYESPYEFEPDLENNSRQKQDLQKSLLQDI